MSTATSTGVPELENDAASGISFRVREPADGSPARATLLLLHGVGGNESQLLSLAPLLPAGLRLVFVRSVLTLGPGAYAWFPVQFGPQGPRIDAAQAERSRLALLSLVGTLQQRWSQPAGGTLIAGFSQGGILSASVGLSAPQSVAGFGVLSGRILPEIEPHLAAPDALAGVHGFIAHGQRDDKLTVQWAHRADEWPVSYTHLTLPTKA